MQKNVYFFDPLTRYFVGTGLADPDPLELEQRRAAAREAILAPAREAINTEIVVALREARPAVHSIDIETVERRADEAALLVQPKQWLVPAFSTLQRPPSVPPGHVAQFVDGAWGIVEVPPPAVADIGAEQEEDPAAVARLQRDRLLASTDWLVTRHQEQVLAGVETALTAEKFAQLAAWRQSLRDAPMDPSMWEDIPEGISA